MSYLQKYRDLLLVYKNPKIFVIMLLGIASGLPLPLTSSTLDAVLNEAGVTKTAIGLFAIIGTPYSLKFLWAPFIDNFNIPLLSKLIGRRKSWLVVIQILLIIAICMLGFTNPAENLLYTAMLALLVSFLSASQDIVIDAFRIEILDRKEQAAGASSATFGYILSMKMISGAFAFWLSAHYEWSLVYIVMAATIIIVMIAILFAQEPENKQIIIKTDYLTRVKQIAIWPFSDFMKTSKWWLVLLFIILFKLGDAFAGKMIIPFLQDIGFSNEQIAYYLKSLGLLMLLIGTFVGGGLMFAIGRYKSLLICGLLQMFSNLMFVLLAKAGNDPNMLALTIAVENISAGMGTAVFVGYLGSLCNIKYTATQFALLTSFASIGRTWISASSGWFVDLLGYQQFFILSTIIAIPGLIVLIALWKDSDLINNSPK